MFRTLIYAASACNTDTIPTQPHRNSNTHQTKNNTTIVVIQQNSRKILMMDILMSETCWTHKKLNKIASDIKLVFYFSTITMMHSPINIRLISICKAQWFSASEFVRVCWQHLYSFANPKFVAMGGCRVLTLRLPVIYTGFSKVCYKNYATNITVT